MVYTPPKYPAEIPTQTGVDPDLPDLVDDLDWWIAKWPNALKKELIAIMTELGTLPKGSYADVKARLDDITFPKIILPAPGLASTTVTSYGDATTSFITLPSIPTLSNIKLSVQLQDTTAGSLIYLRLSANDGTGWTTFWTVATGISAETWTLFESDWIDLPANTKAVKVQRYVTAGTSYFNGFTYTVK